MAPRKREPKITEADVRAWCNQNHLVMLKQGKIIGYFYGIQYTNESGASIYEIRQAGTLRALARKALRDLGLDPLQIQVMLGPEEEG